MANCCVTYLFFSYSAASIIYLIVGLFAATGNVAVLIEHLKMNDTNGLDESEKEDVKSRTLSQYFLASAIAVIISLLLYIFLFVRKKKGYSNIYQDQNNDNINQQYGDNNLLQIEEEDEDNINKSKSDNFPIELAIDSSKKINDSDSGTEGMKEYVD